jgi:hypothetical protein
MLSKAIGVAALFTCLHYTSYAQSVSTLMGSRSNGLGYASSCLDDEWSLFNNIGGLASVDKVTITSAYDWRPALPIGNRMAATFSVPTSIGVAGLGVFRFGDDVYNEQLLTAGFSNKFGIASLGAKVNYVQYNAEGFGRKGVVTVSFGGIAELTPWLSIGAYISNINQPSLSESDDEHLPTILVTGVGLTLSEKVFATVEVEKDIDYNPTWKTGLEYKPFSKASFRMGFNLNPNTIFFGAGFHTKKTKIDYALQHAVTTGLGHQATISYQW